MNSVLIRPIITEKSMRDAAQNRYTFAVLKEANKAGIGREVTDNFGVKVLKVRTSTVKGRTKRAGKMRKETQTSSWKKAVVEVEKGQKIGLFDVTEGQNPKS